MTLDTFNFVSLVSSLSTLELLIRLAPVIMGIVVVTISMAATWSDTTNLDMHVLSTTQMGVVPTQQELRLYISTKEAELAFFGYTMADLEEAYECATSLLVARAYQTPSVAPATVAIAAPAVEVSLHPEDVALADLWEEWGQTESTTTRKKVMAQLMAHMEAGLVEPAPRLKKIVN